MELVSALKAGSAAISLVSALAKLIKETRGPKEPVPSDPSLTELLHRLQIEAIRMSRDLENRLRDLSRYIHEYGLNPALSLDQQLANLAWYNFVTRARLKTLREEFFAIHRQLTAFLDDAEAMLICANRQQSAAEAFKASLQSKRELDRLFLEPNIPLRTIVEGMLGIAGTVTAELQAA